MSLETQLAAIRAGADKRIPPESLAVMHRVTEEQIKSHVVDRVIKVGSTLPAFALPNQRGETVRSEALLSRGPLVLTVYRGVW